MSQSFNVNKPSIAAASTAASAAYQSDFSIPDSADLLIDLSPPGVDSPSEEKILRFHKKCANHLFSLAMGKNLSQVNTNFARLISYIDQNSKNLLPSELATLDQAIATVCGGLTYYQKRFLLNSKCQLLAYAVYNQKDESISSLIHNINQQVSEVVMDEKGTVKIVSVFHAPAAAAKPNVGKIINIPDLKAGVLKIYAALVTVWQAGETKKVLEAEITKLKPAANADATATAVSSTTTTAANSPASTAANQPIHVSSMAPNFL